VTFTGIVSVVKDEAARTFSSSELRRRLTRSQKRCDSDIAANRVIGLQSQCFVLVVTVPAQRA
jgi:hypothetical protein